MTTSASALLEVAPVLGTAGGGRLAGAALAWALPILVADPLARAPLASGGRRLAAGLLCASTLGAPLAVGLENPLCAWLAVLGSLICTTKIADTFAQVSPSAVAEHGYRRSLVYLLFWPALDRSLALRPLAERKGPLVLRKVGGGAAKLVLGASLLMLGAHLGLPARSFALDHILKLLEVYTIASGASDVGVAAFGLAGFRIPDAFRWPIAATSVLDFWARFNRIVGRWLKNRVYDPLGGARRPVRAILGTFFASGLLHEYAFDAVVPDMAGLQMAFFLLQGLGAVASRPLGRVGRRHLPPMARRSAGIAATLAFVIATSVFFMRCVDRLVSFHGEAGAWLLEKAAAAAPRQGGWPGS
jgi:hypothetical protein